MSLLIEKFYGSYSQFPTEFLAQLDRNFARLAERPKYNITVPPNGNYTLVGTDDVVVYAFTGGNTYYLPHAVMFDGYVFIIKHAGSGVLTVDATNKGQIQSSLGLVNSVTLNPGDGVQFSAGNQNWQII